MDKNKIYNYLKRKGIWFEVTAHQPVYTMKELAEITFPYPQADAKNLFVRDDKKQHYYLLTVKGDKQINLKEFQHKYQTRRLSFASENDLLKILGLLPGAVTPFGLLHDTEHKVQLYIDHSFLDGPGIIGVHPNDNTATVWMKTEDMISILKEHGSTVHVMQIA
ncbi:MAG: prolyl-tRNA synthetase associated domain-containing protein [Eubacterium sp.]|nr:prolyl-tRNA synthetase associated domain-containing protein [Eubacterium sp.]